MKLQVLTATTVLLLASSVAFASEPVKTDPPKSREAVTASTSSTTSGGSGAGSQQSGPSASRSRAEIHAEAVEAAKNHRATLSESLDFLKN